MWPSLLKQIFLPSLYWFFAFVRKGATAEQDTKIDLAAKRQGIQNVGSGKH
jgi:hypothetical protein